MAMYTGERRSEHVTGHDHSSGVPGRGVPAPGPTSAAAPPLRHSINRVSITYQVSAPTAVQDVARSPGRALDPPVRDEMETRLGADLSGVRIHTDAAAHAAAASVGALAYTDGSHIVFQAGRYAPASSEGGRLLAHELTHVLQPSTRQAGGGFQVTDPSDASERFAAANAEHVMGGSPRSAPVGPSREPGPRPMSAGRLLQRMVTPYTDVDFAQGDPNQDFLQHKVIFLRYQRPSIESAVKTAVDKFGDNEGVGTYKHCVPWDRIFKGLESTLVGMSRASCVVYLGQALAWLQIKDTSGLPAIQNRVQFDAWLSWAVEAICDWPKNIFRGPSAGDQGGTVIDRPTDVSGALITRLAEARKTLKLIGIDVRLDEIPSDMLLTAQ
ncbi:DUF4157 domain-containing protein [Streptosporangiaceae bacterium NEAU-GS5]|nr:DUF4157 domain-containing protein [Streptosporangiaceae bacterium NEAU-GS5]